VYESSVVALLNAHLFWSIDAVFFAHQHAKTQSNRCMDVCTFPATESNVARFDQGPRKKKTNSKHPAKNFRRGFVFHVVVK